MSLGQPYKSCKLAPRRRRKRKRRRRGPLGSAVHSVADRCWACGWCCLGPGSQDERLTLPFCHEAQLSHEVYSPTPGPQRSQNLIWEPGKESIGNPVALGLFPLGLDSSRSLLLKAPGKNTEDICQSQIPWSYKLSRIEPEKG